MLEYTLCKCLIPTETQRFLCLFSTRFGPGEEEIKLNRKVTFLKKECIQSSDMELFRLLHGCGKLSAGQQDV